MVPGSLGAAATPSFPGWTVDICRSRVCFVWLPANTEGLDRRYTRTVDLFWDRFECFTRRLQLCGWHLHQKHGVRCQHHRPIWLSGTLLTVSQSHETGVPSELGVMCLALVGKQQKDHSHQASWLYCTTIMVVREGGKVGGLAVFSRLWVFLVTCLSTMCQAPP